MGGDRATGRELRTDYIRRWQAQHDRGGEALGGTPLEMLANRPGQIGGLTLPNRIVLAPMISNLANPDGSTNEAHIAYLAARARGGAGLLITEYTFVNDRNARGSRNELGAYHPDFVPKLRRLPESINDEGGRIFLQLVHCGGRAGLDTNPDRPYAPSLHDYPGATPREMSAADFEAVVEDFARAARLAEHANFDGIEIHGAHGYLIHQTVSPALNQRTDRYGGSFEKRLTCPREVLDAVRGAVDLPVGARLSLYEDEDDGYDPEYGLRVAEALEGLDYVHFSAGRFSPPGSSASFYSPRLHIARRLPRKPRVATMVVGSVLGRADVEQALEKADFVSVARGMLADPYFARRVLGSPGTLRPCIRCNQACRDLSWGEVRCTVNPEVGHEGAVRPPLHLRGELVVVGGGPQGLEAALWASAQGLRVTLYEQAERVGGQLLRIVDGPKREGFQPLVDYYERSLAKRGVVVVTGNRYTGEGLRCLPEVEYPDLLATRPASVDSNIFQHHDQILALAEQGPIAVSERSLSSLDRVRAEGYRHLARRKGVTFLPENGGVFEYSLHEAPQYDLRRAIVAGRRGAARYVDDRLSDYQ